MSVEIQKVLERAEDCLSDAEFSLQHGRLLVSANRSYYCVFDCIAALLIDKEIFAKTHQGAHTKFNELYIKTQLMDSKLNSLLLFVFDLRQTADYDFTHELAEQEVSTALEHARTFLAATKSYFGMKG
ncbi:MAG: HEPN domain-containing protein [Saprospiraceae bacterium]